MDTIEGSLDAKAVLRRVQDVSATADAVFMPKFTAKAVISRYGYAVLSSLDAYIEGPTRMQHDRGGSPHYDNDLDSVIVLATALGVYEKGMDVHSVLTAVVNRVAALESKDGRFPSVWLYANAVLRRPDIVAALTAAAILVWQSSADVVVDAILKRIQQHQVTADSVLLAGRESSFTIDAYLLNNAVIADATADAVIWKAIELVATAAAVVLREQEGSLQAESILHREWSASVASDAVVLRILSGQATADSIVLKITELAGTADAVLFSGAGAEGSLTADAILKALSIRKARITQAVIEVMVQMPTPSPTTPVGAGVTQGIVETMITGNGNARVSQIVVETMASGYGNARMAHAVVEVMVAMPTPSPTTPVGAGVTQDIVETMITGTNSNARITQMVIEMMVKET
jgi:hypothetical protein